jgi:hypothetical protein
MSLVGLRTLFIGWEFVVGVGGYGHWRGERPRLYLTLRSFLVPQTRMPICLVVVVAAEHVSDEGDVFGLELPCFELDDDVAGLFSVEKEQVHVEVISVEVEVDLAADEGEARAQFAESLCDSAG